MMVFVSEATQPMVLLYDSVLAGTYKLSMMVAQPSVSRSDTCRSLEPRCCAGRLWGGTSVQGWLTCGAKSFARAGGRTIQAEAYPPSQPGYPPPPHLAP